MHFTNLAFIKGWKEESHHETRQWQYHAVGPDMKYRTFAEQRAGKTITLLSTMLPGGGVFLSLFHMAAAALRRVSGRR